MNMSDPTTHPIGSVEQRLGALEQDMAATKRAVDTNANEILRIRDVLHDNFAPNLQRLIVQGDAMSKMGGGIEVSIATLAAQMLNTTGKVDSHMADCVISNRDASKERKAFRKEIRGYMVLLVIAAVGWFLATKYHLTIASGG